MTFQASYKLNNTLTFLYCTVASSYLRAGATLYNVTVKDPVGNNYTATAQQSNRGEFIITNLTAV